MLLLLLSLVLLTNSVDLTSALGGRGSCSHASFLCASAARASASCTRGTSSFSAPIAARMSAAYSTFISALDPVHAPSAATSLL